MATVCNKYDITPLELGETSMTKDTHGMKWQGMLERPEQYKCEHGDCNAPTTYDFDKSLGTWVRTQSI